MTGRERGDAVGIDLAQLLDPARGILLSSGTMASISASLAAMRERLAILRTIAASTDMRGR